MISYSRALAIVAAVLVLVTAFCFLMTRLATKKRARAIVVRHEVRLAVREFAALKHSTRCRCAMADGRFKPDPYCQSLTRLALRSERKRLEQKKSAEGVNPPRNSLSVN